MSEESRRADTAANDEENRKISGRRRMLLAGTALATFGTLAAGAAVQQAQAQQTPAPATGGGKPNILVIFGDDIGISNISAYSDGLMGYATPNIDRIAKEGIRFLHYYGEQCCTAGRAAFLTGQHGLRTGLTKVGFPGAPMGMSQLDPSDRRPAQEPRLRHRPVRQEPRRRPQRVAAHGQRLRRVLRQPLPPQRRGGAGAARLSEGPGLPRQVRPARRAQVQGHRQGRSRPSIRASARSASRPSRTPARSPRSGWRRSTTRPPPRPSTT